MLKQLTLLFVMVTLALSIQMERRELQDASITISVDNRVGFHRVLTETLLSDALAVVGLSGYGSAVLDDTELSGDVQVNAATFAIQTPGVPGADLSFYFGFLEASASFSVSSGSVMGSVSGSLAELLAAFYSVVVYEDRDSAPGFQYNINEQVLDCDNTGTYDCIHTDLVVDLKSLSWLDISKNSINCTSSLTEDQAGQECTVTVYTLKDADNTVIFDFKTTTHPLTLDGVDLDPDFGKLDVSINYDWTGVTGCDNCKIGLSAGTAGKATDASLSISADEDSLTSTATFSAGDLSAFFKWESSASISGASSTVHYSAVKASDFDAWSCTLLECLTPSAILNLFFKAALDLWGAFGWDSTIIVFSWNDVKPASVFWDPAVGGTDSNRIDDSQLPAATTTNGAPSTIISFILVQLFVLLNFW